MLGVEQPDQLVGVAGLGRRRLMAPGRRSRRHRAILAIRRARVDPPARPRRHATEAARRANSPRGATTSPCQPAATACIADLRCCPLTSAPAHEVGRPVVRSAGRRADQRRTRKNSVRGRSGRRSRRWRPRRVATARAAGEPVQVRRRPPPGPGTSRRRRAGSAPAPAAWPGRRPAPDCRTGGRAAPPRRRPGGPGQHRADRGDLGTGVPQRRTVGQVGQVPAAGREHPGHLAAYSTRGRWAGVRAPAKTSATTTS